MNKLIIPGIVGTTVVIGGLLAFTPLLEAAAATLTVDTAVVDFRPNDDKITIRGTFDGISPTTNAADLRITVTIDNLRTGEQATSVGPPTKIQ